MVANVFCLAQSHLQAMPRQTKGREMTDQEMEKAMWAKLDDDLPDHATDDEIEAYKKGWSARDAEVAELKAEITALEDFEGINDGLPLLVRFVVVEKVIRVKSRN